MTADDKLPAFMAPKVRLTAPVFTPDDLLPGMTVWVRQRHGGRSNTVKAKVISKARVWITAEEIGRPAGQPRRWRFRMDDQTDGTDSNYADRFRTVAQQEYEQTRAEASAFLSEQGIRADTYGRWKDCDIQLARLIWPGRKR